MVMTSDAIIGETLVEGSYWSWASTEAQALKKLIDSMATMKADIDAHIITKSLVRLESEYTDNESLLAYMVKMEAMYACWD